VSLALRGADRPEADRDRGVRRRRPGYLPPSSIDAFVRHGVPVIAVVGNDAGWTQIAREQKKLLGDDVGVVLANSAYHKVAAGFRAEGLLLKASEEISQVSGLGPATRLCDAARRRAVARQASRQPRPPL
jgi:hypothetical protein